MSTIIEEEIHAYTPAPHPISWGAVVAGLIFTFALSWVLFTLGSAVGLSLMDFESYEAEPDKMTLGIGALVWIFITTLIAFFLGGLLAGRLAGKPDQAIGMLHGVSVWASTVVLSLLLGSIGVAGIASSAMNAVRTATAGAASAISAAPDANGQIPASMQPLLVTLKQEIAHAVAKTANEYPGRDVSPRALVRATDQLDLYTLSVIASALIRGDETQAKNILAGSTQLAESDIDQIIMATRERATEVAKTVEKNAEKVKEYASATLWIVFVSSAAALLAAIVGGLLGAASVARIYSFRLY